MLVAGLILMFHIYARWKRWMNDLNVKNLNSGTTEPHNLKRSAVKSLCLLISHLESKALECLVKEKAAD
ncbi:hypothetical protein ILYODFUR_014779 [Ilyodon furcidens]|uniref:Uncharacterized protein n=1 Tax=Ilyodon furcidens TaxID=33524 RepID=A0ABV0SLA4_9TELE